MHWNKHITLFFLLLVVATLGACQDDEPQVIEMDTTPYELTLPDGFPIPELPEGNELTIARVALGKKLFYDPILSRDSTVSCASCHFQHLAFTDGLAVSEGIDGGMTKRNSPTLANIAYHPYFFRDGGSLTLELQVLGPIEDENEMGNSVLSVVERLKNVPEYVEMTARAYGRELDVYSVTRAIAAFQRTMISGNSRYDQYLHQNQTDVLTESEIRGMNLFMSDDLACSTCHSGFDFTQYQLENNGLYAEYADDGRYRISVDSSDLGKFKVPTLRNIALTAPYMHDGSVATLQEVIQHYNTGGQGHPNQSEHIQDLHLTVEEQADLLHFLESLTDEEFITNPAYELD